MLRVPWPRCAGRTGPPPVRARFSLGSQRLPFEHLPFPSRNQQVLLSWSDYIRRKPIAASSAGQAGLFGPNDGGKLGCKAADVKRVWEQTRKACSPFLDKIRRCRWGLAWTQVTTPTQQALAAKPGNGRAVAAGSGGTPEPDNAVTEMLENTLWNRQLGVMSEEIVAALVCQIFEGA